MLAASHTTELAARFGRGPLLGGYLKPHQPCASRDALACVERAADPLNSRGVNPEPYSDLSCRRRDASFRLDIQVATRPRRAA